VEPIRIARTIDLPATVEEVWTELTEPDRLSRWFGARVEIELRPGGRVAVLEADGTQRLGVVETIEPGRRLAFRWAPFSRSPDGAPSLSPPGRVEFELEARDGGTRLLVTETRHPTAGVGADLAIQSHAGVVA
jgi:uncharacterized protein YndB with AHSA1/START domain